MNIVVFGASGRVGSLLCVELLSRGHEVTGFVYGKHSLPADVNIVQGDIHDAAAVSNAIAGAQVVVSTLGSWGTPTKDILRAGFSAIIPAMQQHGVRRVISLTGSAALLPNEKSTALGKIDRLALGIIDRKVLQDGEAHLGLLAQSELDWTCLRSPVMTEKGDAARFIVRPKPPRPLATIHRGSVVTAMADLAEDNRAWVRQAPHIVRAS